MTGSARLSWRNPNLFDNTVALATSASSSPGLRTFLLVGTAFERQARRSKQAIHGIAYDETPSLPPRLCG